MSLSNYKMMELYCGELLDTETMIEVQSRTIVPLTLVK